MKKTALAAALLLAACTGPDTAQEPETTPPPPSVDVTPEASTESLEAGAEVGTQEQSEVLETVSEAATTGWEQAQEVKTDEPPITISELPEEERRELMILALEITWESTSQEDKDSICFGWAVDEETMLDAFMEGGEDVYDRDLVASFFEEVCDG